MVRPCLRTKQKEWKIKQPKKKFIKNPHSQLQTNTILPWVTVSIMYIVVQTKRTQLSGAVLPDTHEDIIDVIFFH